MLPLRHRVVTGPFSLSAKFRVCVYVVYLYCELCASFLFCTIIRSSMLGMPPGKRLRDKSSLLFFSLSGTNPVAHINPSNPSCLLGIRFESHHSSTLAIRKHGRTGEQGAYILCISAHHLYTAKSKDRRGRETSSLFPIAYTGVSERGNRKEREIAIREREKGAHRRYKRSLGPVHLKNCTIVREQLLAPLTPLATVPFLFLFFSQKIISSPAGSKFIEERGAGRRAESSRYPPQLYQNS